MFTFDFSKAQQAVISALGAVLLTIGAFGVAAGPAEFDAAPARPAQAANLASA